MNQLETAKAQLMALEFMKVVFNKYHDEPTPEEYATIVGGLVIARDAIQGMMENRGITVAIINGKIPDGVHEIL